MTFTVETSTRESLRRVSKGHGKMTHVNGEVYDGEWKNGMRGGRGKMTYGNGDVYEGKLRE